MKHRDSQYQLCRAEVDAENGLYVMAWTIKPDGFETMKMDTFITPHRPYALYINQVGQNGMIRLPTPHGDEDTQEWRMILAGDEALVNSVSWPFIDQFLTGFIHKYNLKDNWLLPVKLIVSEYVPPDSL